jgi:hypothetical protein
MTTTNLLRLEHAALFVTSTVLYAQIGASWWLYALLFFTPDLAMLGYLVNSRVGALTYNLLHTATLPLALIGIVLLTQTSSIVPVALVWLAHIWFDRTFGYGLKEPTSFNDTHLGRIGRARA